MENGLGLAMNSDFGQDLLLILNASPCFCKNTLLEHHMAETHALPHEAFAFVYILIRTNGPFFFFGLKISYMRLSPLMDPMKSTHTML